MKSFLEIILVCFFAGFTNSNQTFQYEQKHMFGLGKRMWVSACLPTYLRCRLLRSTYLLVPQNISVTVIEHFFTVRISISWTGSHTNIPNRYLRRRSQNHWCVSLTPACIKALKLKMTWGFSERHSDIPPRRLDTKWFAKTCWIVP